MFNDAMLQQCNPVVLFGWLFCRSLRDWHMNAVKELQHLNSNLYKRIVGPYILRILLKHLNNDLCVSKALCSLDLKQCASTLNCICCRLNRCDVTLLNTTSGFLVSD
jgi:hypothetical protein